MSGHNYNKFSLQIWVIRKNNNSFDYPHIRIMNDGTVQCIYKDENTEIKHFELDRKTARLFARRIIEALDATKWI